MLRNMVSLSMLKLEAVKKISEPASWKLAAAAELSQTRTEEPLWGKYLARTPQALRPVTPITPKSMDAFSSSHRHTDIAKNMSLVQLLMLIFPCLVALDQ